MKKPAPTVRAIRFQNFMAFGEAEGNQGWIHLHPVTLLFGRNSSGKSALFRGLRLLRQSLQAGREGIPLNFQVAGSLDQGDFQTVVNQRPVREDEDPLEERLITFGFRCEIWTTIDRVRDRVNDYLKGEHLPLLPSDYYPPELDLHLGFAWDQKNRRVELVSVEIRCPWEPLMASGPATFFAAERGRLDLPPREGEQQSTQWEWASEWNYWSLLLYDSSVADTAGPRSKATIKLVDGFLPALDTRDTAPPGSDISLIEAVLFELRKAIVSFLTSANYIGPLRPESSRVYLQDRGANQNWKHNWEGFARFLTEDVDEPELNSIDLWAARLGLAHKVQPKMHPLFGGLAFGSQVSLQESEGGPSINLADVGSGVSQVLPIVIQAILAQPGTLVMVEQPELHLHPRAEAELADLFLAMSKRGVRFLLETHSEAILLRVRLRVAESNLRRLRRQAKNRIPGLEVPDSEASDTLSPENIGLYYVWRAGSASSVRKIAITKTGDLSEPPRQFADFFSGDTVEILKIAQTALEADRIENEPVDRT